MAPPLLAPAPILVILLGLLLLWAVLRRPGSSRLPPGPPGWPIIGNLLQIPRIGPHIAFTKFAKQYGEIVYLVVFGQPLIILSSHRVVQELLDKRAATSSARPHLVMIEDVCEIGKFASLNSDMDLHQHYRRMFAQALGTRAVQTYWPKQIREMRRAVLETLDASKEPLSVIRRAVSSLTADIVYGYEVKNDDDPFITKVTRILRAVEKTATPGEHVVEGLPFLRHLPTWFPGAQFKRDGLRLKQDCIELREEPYNVAKQAMISGCASTCFTSNLLQGEDEQMIQDEEEEERIKWAASVLYGGGTDTTVAAIQMFLVAMLEYPDVQARAQAEVDRIIGTDRLPTIEDRDNLPYCAAVVQETLRWNPVVPLCIPHLLTEEEIYEGYVLPKGSIVIANSWALARDKTVYPDPDNFTPERFLSEDGQALKDVDAGREVFGFGRRVCPGLHLAEASIFAFVVTFLCAANISRSEDWDGSEIAYELGVINRPKHIPAAVRPRSAHALELLREHCGAGIM